MSQQTIKLWRKGTGPIARKTFKCTPNPMGIGARSAPSASGLPDTDLSEVPASLRQFDEWREKAYRDAYMAEAVDQGIAWQIRINRESRGLSQKQFAAALGTQQSAVSRLEDPDYGAHSLALLKQVARAFDCALLLKLIPFSELAAETERLSPEDLFAAPFTAEVPEHP